MKKILLMAVVICLAATTALFTSCKKEQKSSYQYVVALDDSIEQDESMCAQFQMYGLPVIQKEMQKSADQKSEVSVIFKDTKSNADKRAKDAFAAGIAKLREGGIGSYKDLIVVLKALNNDNNNWEVIDKVAL